MRHSFSKVYFCVIFLLAMAFLNPTWAAEERYTHSYDSSLDSTFSDSVTPEDLTAFIKLYKAINQENARLLTTDDPSIKQDAKVNIRMAIASSAISYEDYKRIGNIISENSDLQNQVRSALQAQ